MTITHDVHDHPYMELVELLLASISTDLSTNKPVEQIDIEIKSNHEATRNETKYRSPRRRATLLSAPSGTRSVKIESIVAQSK